MSYNSGGPSGPNVPPPPGQGSGPYGNQQVPNGPHAGQPHAGHVNTGAHPPEKKSKTGLIIGAVVGGLLLLALCCGGAIFLANRDDDGGGETTTTSSTTETSETTSETTEPTSETTSEPTSETTSEPTSETSSDTGTGGGTFSMPSEFDGWKKVDTSVSAPAGGDVAAYTKGTQALSIVAMDEAPGIMDGFESLWSSEETVGDATCGKYAGQTQCAKVNDGKILLITHGGDAKTTAGYLDDFIGAL